MGDETQPATEWRTRLLRLTAFTTTPGGPLLLARDWWSALTGGSPSMVIEEPQLGVIRLGGLHQDAPLLMQAETGKLDLRGPFQEAGVPNPPLFSEALAPFVALATRWLKLDNAPSIKRLALGVQIRELHPDTEACRSMVDSYLPAVDMQRVALPDFQFQVNRRCPSQTIELSLNRIAKWSVLLADRGGAVDLDLDLNSDPGHGSELHQTEGLLAEFARYAEEFAREGDQE